MENHWQPVDLTSDPHEAEYHGNPADLLDAYEEILEAFRRPAWHREAACRGMGPDTFFPTTGRSAAPAKALCATCPVYAECNATAEADPGVQGVWAGLGQDERRRLRTKAS